MGMPILLLMQAQGVEWQPDASGSILRSILSIVVVIGLIGVLAWLLRRGSLGVLGLTPGRARGPVAVEATVQLGDRRSLMVVSVEGRRMLLGLTPSQVSLLTELREGTSSGQSEFGAKVDARLAPTAERVS